MSLFSLLGLKLAEHCLVEFWLVLLGLLCNISGLLVSFAHTTALMFTALQVRLHCTKMTYEVVVFSQKMMLQLPLNQLSIIV